MRSITVAILWETWRVTRVEAAWKLAVGIIGGLAVLALCAVFAPPDDPQKYEDVMNNGAAAAMTLLVLPHIFVWGSITKLRGARLGFPLYLHYTRPVRTAVIVGLPMAYLAGLSLGIYLVSAFVLRTTSGYAFPLLPIAAWIGCFTLVALAATWSIRNMAFQMIVVIYGFLKIFGLVIGRLTAVELPEGYDWPPRLWPTLFDFPLTDYAWIALTGLVSFGVTVAMVTLQRRGDELASYTRTPGAGLRARLVDLFRIACPTSSATRAQVWFDLKSNGLPVITIGLVLAIAILLLSAIGGPIDAAIEADPEKTLSCSARGCFYWRAMGVLSAMFSPLVVLFLGANAFGIRRKQGRSYLSAFDAARAQDNSQLAALKVLVKSVCVLAALIAVSVSAWASVPLLGDPVFIQMFDVPLNSRLSAISGAIAGLAVYEQISLAVVMSVGVVIWVAAFAALGALWTRYSRRMNIAASLLLFSGFALALLALAKHEGILAPFVFDASFAAARWILLAAMVFTSVYVFRSAIAERLLTIRYASGAVAISAAFAAAWLTVLHIAGVQLVGLSAMNTSWILLPALLPPIFSFLAPWALNRVRHM